MRESKKNDYFFICKDFIFVNLKKISRRRNFISQRRFLVPIINHIFIIHFARTGTKKQSYKPYFKGIPYNPAHFLPHDDYTIKSKIVKKCGRSVQSKISQLGVGRQNVHYRKLCGMQSCGRLPLFPFALTD